MADHVLDTVPETRHYPLLEEDPEPDLLLDEQEEVCGDCHMVRWAPTGNGHCGCGGAPVPYLH